MQVAFLQRIRRSSRALPALFALASLALLSSCGEDAPIAVVVGDAGASKSDIGVVDPDAGADEWAFDAAGVDASDVSAPFAPQLAVVPPQVDFGALEVGHAQLKTLKILNKGQKPLHVFGIVPSPLSSFAPADLQIQPPPPYVIDTGAAQQVALQFTPSFVPGVAGVQMGIGALRLTSDDPVTPTVEVPLSAQVDLPATVTPVVKGPCQLQLTPQPADFSLVPVGQQKAVQLEVKNAGTGLCKFKEIRLLNCYQPPDVFNMPGKTCTPAASSLFQHLPLPTTLFNLGPGGAATFALQLTVPKGLFPASYNGLTLGLQALLILSYTDDAGATIRLPDVDPADLAKVQQTPGNVTAQAAQWKLDVAPPSLDFGDVALTCPLPAAQHVVVSNIGGLAATVTAVTLKGCGPQVQLLNLPALPAGGWQPPLAFDVAYQPKSVTPVGKCTVEITSDQGQVLAVPVNAKTLPNTIIDQKFLGWEGVQVDVLFVVDAGPTLKAAKKALAAALTALFGELKGLSYHVAVTDAQSGVLALADLYRYASPQVGSPLGLAGDLLAAVNAPAAKQAGLESLVAALSPPLTDDAHTACDSAFTCLPKNLACTKLPDDQSMGCGGENRGFLRPGAGLEVVFLADTDDAGAKPVLGYYAAQLASIKASGGPTHVHAIVGPAGGCSSPGTTAAEGSRYATLAAIEGGEVASVCASDFSPVLKAIGKKISGLKVHFPLKSLPQPASLTVSVAGKPCPAKASDWIWDATLNAIVFPVATSTCLPQASETLWIEYDPGCPP